MLTFSFGLLVATTAHADWKTDIGYDRLNLLAGSELPDLPTEGLTQVEATNSETLDRYLPDQTLSEFSGKTFTVKSASSDVSNHATTVAKNFYGSSSGIVSGDCPVDLYFANTWIGTDFLRLSSNSFPRTETSAIQNHSWIGNLTTISQAEESLRRLDYAISRDGFSCVVGMNNGSTTTVPQLLGQSYNSISVGLTNGNHSAGTTTVDGSGRSKPEIVAPHANYTSYATPMVSGAAALLHAKLTASPYSLTGADLPRVTKALLMAGARKDTVASWSNSSSAPLDSTYGAGELNIFLAYKTLSAGRVTSSSVTSYGTHGWAAESISDGTTKTYYFTVPQGSQSPPATASLTWHREVTTTSPLIWNGASSQLTNLNLKLHQANGLTLGSEITNSSSTVDNVELIYQPSLPPGDYAWVVEYVSSSSGSDPDTQYALAWQTLPVVSVSASDVSASEIDSSTGEITVTRSDDTTLPLLVTLTTGGTAVADTDYIAISTSITIPAGDSSITIPITPVSDDTAQGDRILTVQVSTDFTYTEDSSQTAEITIEDKPFDNWRFTNFDTTELADLTISGDIADPDSDNLQNLYEYALDLDPSLFNSTLLLDTESSGHITLTATKNPDATDITWSAEDSEDLETWDTAEIITDDGTTFKARDTSTTPGEGERFLRLKITRP
ncbi:MAG: Calx-beta domain-containing protein [Luteolibacter sp.]